MAGHALRQIMRSAAVCILLAASAHAEASRYLLALSGSYSHQEDCWETPDLCESGPPPVVSGPWTGDLTLVLQTHGDGLYEASDGYALLDSDFGSGAHGPMGLLLSGTVTVADGLVSSIDGSADYPLDARLFFNGLSVYLFQPPLHHLGSYEGYASLASISGSVPEPADWALCAAGLCALWPLRRRLSAMR